MQARSGKREFQKECKMMRFVCVFLLCVLSLAGAQDNFKQSPYSIDGGIPLPRQLSYTGIGLNMGLALGVTSPLGNEKKFLAAWNLDFEYFYKPFWSAGGEVWIYGGDVDSHTMVLYNRYRIHSRFHYQLFKKLNLFGGPLVWLETTDIGEINLDDEENAEDDKDRFSSVYDDAPEQNGFAVGAELGGGARVAGNLGIVFETVFEKSFSDDPLISFTGGVAYDIRAHSNMLKRNVYSCWISVEATIRRYLSGDWKSLGRYVLIGVNLGL